jgi:electron transport complex protein RnfE
MNGVIKKSFFDKILLALLPLMAVCKTLSEALLAAVVIGISLLLTDLCVHCIGKQIIGAPLGFASVVITLGFIGVFAALATLFAKGQVESIGVYLYIPAVTGVIFSQDKKSGFINSFKTSAVNSLSFALILTVSGLFREFMGMGSIFGVDIYTKLFAPIGFFTTPAGGLMTAALLLIVCRVVFGKAGKEAENE